MEDTTPQRSGGGRRKRTEAATFAIRLGTFVLTLVPFLALAAPWVTLDGIGEAHSGVELTALLSTPAGVYLYSVSFVQAAILSVGPIVILLLAAVTSYRYHRRRRILWAPLAMFAAALAIPLGAGSFVVFTHYGLNLVVLVSAILVLHQAFIGVYLALRGRRKLPAMRHALGVATGAGPYRWSEG